MSDKKHIDRLFQEGLKDFEATPSDAVWKNIEAELNKKKKKRRVIPIWWRYAGVAALIMVLLTIGRLFLNHKNEVSTHQVVGSEDSNSNDIKILNNNKTNEINPVITNNNDDKDTLTNKTKINHGDVVTSKQSSIAKTPVSNNKNKTTLPTSGKQDLNNPVINQKKPNNNAYASGKDDDLIPSKNNIQDTDDTITTSSVAKNSKSKHKNNSKTLPPLHQTKTINNTLNNTQKNHAVANSNSSKEKKDGDKTLDTSNKTQIASVNNKNRSLNKDENTKTQIEDINTDDKNNTAIAENKTKENGRSIEDELEENKILIKEKDKKSKWAITPNAAPVYFNTLGEGSSIDPQFKNNSKQGEVNISYGISASYAINNRLSVRSGINKVNLGYNTNDVAVFQSTNNVFRTNRPSLQNVSNASDEISILSTENLSSNTRSPQSIITSNSSINQTLGYIEVPLELQYKVLDKKVGIHIIGGFSSFFLSENDVFSETQNGDKTFLGKATNVNDISYSANFGLGLNYQVSKNIDLNLEPIFKYQFNTFNNTTGNVTPFIIGVYTGFAIKF
ncbi:hypothetical protein [uncultured Algibacter sp.]|uniref:hypothetical protein n=1 Tax=uncultured Algibacter sp. TaxID=298659 RepID=UPI0032175C1B